MTKKERAKLNTAIDHLMSDSGFEAGMTILWQLSGRDSNPFAAFYESVKGGLGVCQFSLHSPPRAR